MTNLRVLKNKEDLKYSITKYRSGISSLKYFKVVDFGGNRREIFVETVGYRNRFGNY